MDTAKIKAGLKELVNELTNPLPGESLAAHYVAKRGRELALVARQNLTAGERGRHVRRLLRIGQTAHAEALHRETMSLILDGTLKATPKEKQWAEADLQRTIETLLNETTR